MVTSNGMKISIKDAVVDEFRILIGIWGCPRIPTQNSSTTAVAHLAANAIGGWMEEGRSEPE